MHDGFGTYFIVLDARGARHLRQRGQRVLRGAVFSQ
jgi:hypothetical protein